jgi:polyketide cyclase/dehydrase/lipid transport protein
MQKFINWLLVIGALVGLFYVIGLIVPRSETKKCETQLHVKPEQLYALVADVSTWPKWFPDVTAVREGPEKNDLPTWNLTFKDGTTSLLEVMNADEDKLWQAFYSRKGSRCTLRFVFGWYGEGGRIHLSKVVDTRDPWIRAKLFLWLNSDATPIAIVNALGQHLGEVGKTRDA